MQERLRRRRLERRRASSIAGVEERGHGRRPRRSCASARPGTQPGHGDRLPRRCGRPASTRPRSRPRSRPSSPSGADGTAKKQSRTSRLVARLGEQDEATAGGPGQRALGRRRPRTSPRAPRRRRARPRRAPTRPASAGDGSRPRSRRSWREPTTSATTAGPPPDGGGPRPLSAGSSELALGLGARAAARLDGGARRDVRAGTA